MEENKSTIWKDALKPGIILGVINVIITLLVYIFNLATIGIFAFAIIGLTSFVISVIVLAFLIKSYRIEKLKGFIPYGKALVFGIVISLYVAVITTSYTVLFNTAIDPDYEKNVTMELQQKTEEFLIKKGLPDDQIEAQMDASAKKIKKNENKSFFLKTGQGLIGSFIMMVLVSLIAAAFGKKNDDPYQAAMQDIDEE